MIFFPSQFKMSTVVIEIVKKLCASSITPFIKSHVLNIKKKRKSCPCNENYRHGQVPSIIIFGRMKKSRNFLKLYI